MKTVTLIKFVEEKVAVIDPYCSQIRYLGMESMHRTTDGKLILPEIVDDVKTVVSPVHEIWNRQEFRRSALGLLQREIEGLRGKYDNISVGR